MGRRKGVGWGEVRCVCVRGGLGTRTVRRTRRGITSVWRLLSRDGKEFVMTRRFEKGRCSNLTWVLLTLASLSPGGAHELVVIAARLRRLVALAEQVRRSSSSFRRRSGDSL